MSLIPWNDLNTFIHDWMKGLQEIADEIAPDPGADNSMLPLTSLPYKYDATCYTTIPTDDVLDGYDNYSKGYGYQRWMIAFRVNLTNGVLRILNQSFLGKAKMSGTDYWHYLTDEDIAAIESAGKLLYDGNTITVLNSYSANETLIECTNQGAVRFYPAAHSYTDIKYSYPKKNGAADNTNNSSINNSSYAAPAFNENTGFWEPDWWASYTDIGDAPRFSLQDKVIAVFSSDTEANYFVSRLTDYNTNNDVINYTKSGSEYKLYYGDKYLVYALNSSNIYSYNDLFTGTNQATTAISGWHPSDPPVITPTYNEVKHEGEPGIDEDIEVDMTLNDAAFGEGLSHYYVTTVDAPVLSDISEAMSTWDINNTGKDLYRNLLSCRITKVGPIPAKNSTFVIYGEELLHSGSPIAINKITGNPSMDLGEYEIKPKFNDFRDYAPYTKIEMFIPYCGWVALPSHVMSSEEEPKIITGTLLCDIIAGTCKAVIKCNDTVIAEASGFTAVDVPFTGENVGMKMAGIASAITSYGNTASKTVGNIASGGMSGGAGAGASAAGGLVGLLGSYAQLHSAFNANYTEICGKTGDGCNVAGLNKVYIKIQRPKTGGYEAPDFVPEDYGNTTGFISMKKKQISECEGLIVCANPDTSGIGGATDRERQMIKNLLESGIIVRQVEPEP